MFRSFPVLVMAGTLSGANPAPPDPDLTPEDWRALAAARHAVLGQASGLTVRHPLQGFGASFDERGFVVRDEAGRWSFGLSLEGAPATCLRGSGPRVDLERGPGLVEWWISTERGLEHGLTLRTPPASAPAGRVELRFALDGNLRPRVSDTGRDVLLLDANGLERLRYGGLVVQDACGRPLDARIECDGNALRLSIDDRGASYPLTVDPLVETAYLKASNTGAGDRFGAAVAISGNTCVIGAPGECCGMAGVNAPGADDLAPGAGAAYVFVRSASGWVQQAFLKASNPDADDAFGCAVAISRDTIVIGARAEDSSASYVNGDGNDDSLADSGAAYVFVRHGNHWTQEAYLKPANTGGGDRFGASVAVSNDTILVGAPGEASHATGIDGDSASDLAPGAGAAYVFTRAGTTWTQGAYLKASNTQAWDSFGCAVAIAIDTLVVGASGEDSGATGPGASQTDESAPEAGAAYVFALAGGTCSQKAYLKASNAGAHDAFGASVAVARVPPPATGVGGGLGDPDVDPAPSSYPWGSAGHPGSWDTSPDVVVVGAHGESGGAGAPPSDDGSPAAGAAYVFRRTGAAWIEEARLKAANAGAGDRFGASVAIEEYGRTIVVGAPEEDSGAMNVNGDANDESASAAGAAYAFEWRLAGWTQVGYVKASNAGAGDRFGTSVAVSLANVVAGAPLEDGAGIGPHANPASSAAPDAGAAYALRAGAHVEPAPFCFGDGLATACPCGNAGAFGSGCASASFPGGARLGASGVASVTATAGALVLEAADVSGPALFLHGSERQLAGAGFAFGDGILCVGGTIVRLGVAFPVGGIAAHDAGGPFSAGEVRHYQAWYRDAATFCSSAAFNLTNGLTVAWGG